MWVGLCEGLLVCETERVWRVCTCFVFAWVVKREGMETIRQA